MTNNESQLQQLTLKRLDTPRSRRVCELAVAITRLNHAKERLLLSVQIARQSRDEQYAAISDSLMRDAIVTFLGCFDKNKDLNLERSIFTDAGELDAFNQLKDFRDSTVAHMFGALHQADYVLVLDPNSGEFLNGACHQVSISGSTGFSQLFSPILQRSIEFTNEEMKKELEILTEEIKGMQKAELQSLSDHDQTKIPGAGQWKHSRKGFKQEQEEA